jgi:hypothetical protein
VTTTPVIQNTMIKLADLAPHPSNYRTHPESQIQDLMASLLRFGQVKSIVIQEGPHPLCVAGHGIVEAARRLDYSALRADVIPADWSPADVKGYLIADNQHAANALDDEAQLSALLQEQREAGFDLSSLGSSEDELQAILDRLEEEGEGGYAEGGGGDDFDTTPDEDETRSRSGDIWQLGRHRIACIDALDVEQVKRLFDGKVADFVFSDPPYGIEIVALKDEKGFVGGGAAYDYPFGGVKNVRGSNGASKPFGSKAERGTVGIGKLAKVGLYASVIGDDSPETAIASYRFCTEFFPKAVHIWWGANYYANALPPSSCWIVWDKENDASYFADCELAWCNDDGAVRIFRHLWNGMLRESEQGIKRVHPTQKPIALPQWCYEKYGKEHDLIYDPFLGSGITVIAAERMGNRTVYGCELSPEYIDVIIRRWEAETGGTASLLTRLEVSV